MKIKELIERLSSWDENNNIVVKTEKGDKDIEGVFGCEPNCYIKLSEKKRK